jgi:hypothetical protein
MIRAMIYELGGAADESVAKALVFRGRILIESKDQDLKARLELFFASPAIEHDRDVLGILRSALAFPGSGAHFASRSQHLHTVGLRAVLSA